MMRRLRYTGVALLTLASACWGDGSRLGGPDGIIQTGSSSTTAAIVGTWQRTIIFTDDFGFVQSSETTWRFTSDGAATRTVVARNLTTGAFDTVVTQATWTIDGTTVVLQFTAPNTGETRLSFSVQNTTLILAGFSFSRVG
jgi:hypothetical protein